ncbi:hypothetical protein GCM10020229_34100 [Kitasatospora albolonga]
MNREDRKPPATLSRRNAQSIRGSHPEQQFGTTLHRERSWPPPQNLTTIVIQAGTTLRIEARIIRLLNTPPKTVKVAHLRSDPWQKARQRDGGRVWVLSQV